MMKRHIGMLLVLTASLVQAGETQAQQYYWSSFAGKPGTSGNADGTGNAAQFNSPFATAVDSAGNVYVADSASNTIRKMTLSGSTWTVITLAGSPGSPGTADGTGATAQFNMPTGITVDAAGNAYVADSNNFTVRKITPAGAVATLAGTPGQSGYADEGTALFGCPSGVAVDSSGNVYVADSVNHTIRKVTSGGVVTTFAGIPGQPGYADGPCSAAQFNTPTGIAVDSSGNVYVADTGNNTIRKVTAAGVVTTLAGNALTAGSPGAAGFANGPG